MSINFYAQSFTKETSTIVGTGDYVLDGPMTGFSPFSRWFADGDYAPLSITDGTKWEVGYYKYNAGPNSFTRVFVANSSDDDTYGVIDWTAGVKVVRCASVGEITGAAALYTSGSGPSLTGVDVSNGFLPGQMIGDLSDGVRLLMLLDTTVGAQKSIYIATADYITNTLGPGWQSNILCGKHNEIINNGRYSTVIAGSYAKGIRQCSSIHGFNNNVVNTPGAFQGEEVGLIAVTTDTTATLMSTNSVGFGPEYLTVPQNSCVAINGTLIAHDNADNLSSMWTIKGLFRRATGNVSAVGSPSATMEFQDAGASGLVVTVSADTTNQAAGITVTGLASKTFRWTFYGRLVQVGF